ISIPNRAVRWRCPRRWARTPGMAATTPPRSSGCARTAAGGDKEQYSEIVTMGKTTGFLEYPRELPLAAPPVERSRRWEEFHGHGDETLLRQQGARCMDCGVPFCHTGALIEGMAAGCPINNLIPEWNDLVYCGHWKEALERLHKTNNFPEFTGRVCPAPC